MSFKTHFIGNAKRTFDTVTNGYFIERPFLQSTFCRKLLFGFYMSYVR